MHPDVFVLAATKAASELERQRLETVIQAARQHQAVADAFESRINASKALRGEGPTRVSRGQRAELDALARDAERGQAEVLEHMAQVDSAAEILAAVLPALEDDVAFWAQSRRHAHPADLPVIDDFTQAKAALRDAVAACLDDRDPHHDHACSTPPAASPAR